MTRFAAGFTVGVLAGVAGVAVFLARALRQVGL